VNNLNLALCGISQHLSPKNNKDHLQTPKKKKKKKKERREETSSNGKNLRSFSTTITPNGFASKIDLVNNPGPKKRHLKSTEFSHTNSTAVRSACVCFLFWKFSVISLHGK